jgi:hypothetical protein
MEAGPGLVRELSRATKIGEMVNRGVVVCSSKEGLDDWSKHLASWREEKMAFKQSEI